MSSSSSSTTALVAGSAALLAVAGLGYWTLSTKASTSSKSYEVGDIEDEELYDENEIITANEIVQIFDKLFLELQSIFGQLMQQVQQLQMAGQMIPEKQLKQLIRAELERAITVKQKLIIEDTFAMDLDCCEEATWEYITNGNTDVKKAVERFQKLWENATGEPVTGWQPGKVTETTTDYDILSPEDTIHAAEIYFNSLTDCMRTLVNQYKADGKDLKNPSVQQQLNIDFSTKVSDAGEDALRDTLNITLTQFESSIKFHANNPTVGRALGMLQMKQQQDMMNIG